MGRAKAPKTRKDAKERRRRQRQAVFTQDQLAQAYGVDWVRQPKNEVLVVHVSQYEGVKRVKYNAFGGAYLAHYWSVVFETMNGARVAIPMKGLMDIPKPRWNESKLKMRARDLEGLYTLEANTVGTILWVKEGDVAEGLVYDFE